MATADFDSDMEDGDGYLVLLLPGEYGVGGGDDGAAGDAGIALPAGLTLASGGTGGDGAPFVLADGVLEALLAAASPSRSSSTAREQEARIVVVNRVAPGRAVSWRAMSVRASSRRLRRVAHSFPPRFRG
jgi:hypothetical protein